MAVELNPVLRVRTQPINRIAREHYSNAQTFKKLLDDGRLRIYEATTPQRLAALQSAIAADAGYAVRIKKLTDDVAQKLDVFGQIGPERAHAAVWREPDIVLPGERFFSLQVPAQPRARKRSIHRRYSKPWQFVLTRAEAKYDMLNRPTARLRKLLDRVGRRERIRKWRALLYGHTAQEQLWGVRPPRRAYDDREIVAWAERMLSAAGYDPARGIAEWEIFWRRKGV